MLDGLHRGPPRYSGRYTKTAICNVTDNDALKVKVINEHVRLRSARRDSIHRDIRNFVTETYPTRFANPQKDLVLEKIINLIKQYCNCKKENEPRRHSGSGRADAGDAE